MGRGLVYKFQNTLAEWRQRLVGRPSQAVLRHSANVLPNFICR